MADVFISYSNHNRADAVLVKFALEEAGKSVWFDDRIEAGERWDDRIEAELRSAAAVLVLWSPHAASSEWVRAEANLAKELQKFVPVVIHNCELPLQFRYDQAADLVDWQMDTKNPEWAKVCLAIEKLVYLVERDERRDVDQDNHILSCKWTGWHTNENVISQVYRYAGSSHPIAMRFDCIVAPNQMRIPGIPRGAQSIIFMFLSDPLSHDRPYWLSFSSEDRKSTSGRLHVRSTTTDDGGSIVGFLSPRDNETAFKWLADGPDGILELSPGEVAEVCFPLPYESGLREQRLALLEKLRS